jgi:hypothetical protein
MNKLIIISVSLFLLLFNVSAFSQESRSIEINYAVNGRVKKIKDLSKIIFTQSVDTFESRICSNKVCIPTGIDSTSIADVLFIFGGKELFFASVSIKKLLLDQEVIWELGYYNKFNNKTKDEFYQVKDFSKIQELYYWKFRPQEFGDGTITLVTIPKN